MPLITHVHKHSLYEMQTINTSCIGNLIFVYEEVHICLLSTYSGLLRNISMRKPFPYRSSFAFIISHHLTILTLFINVSIYNCNSFTLLGSYLWLLIFWYEYRYHCTKRRGKRRSKFGVLSCGGSEVNG